MALPTWTDAQKLLKAITDPQTKYNNIVNGPTSAYNTAKKNLDTAKDKLDGLQTDFDNGKYAQTAAITNLQKAVTTAKTDAARKAAQTKVDTAINTAKTNAQKAITTQANLISGEKNKNNLTNAFNTADTAYQKALSTAAPNMEARDAAIKQFNGFVDNVKNSIGEAKTITEAKNLKTLVGQLNTGITSTKIPELTNQVSVSGLDPVATFKENLPALEQTYQQNFQLPTLSVSEVDKVLKDQSKVYNRAGPVGDGNTLLMPTFQSMGDDYLGGVKVNGLNLKSINGNITTGAALFGIYRRQLRNDKKSIEFSGDFNKAAQTAGIDITGMTKQQAYDAINEKGQGYYAVTSRTTNSGNPINPATGKSANHFFAMYKKEGDQLVPMTNAKTGMPIVKPFNAASFQPDEDWYAPILQIAPFVLPFVLPGIGSAISSAISGTTLGAAIGAAGTTVLSSALLSAGMAAITGGDIGKALTTGLVSGGLSIGVAAVAKNVVGAANIAEIAKITGMTNDQVSRIIAAGVSTGLASAVTDPDNVGQNILTSIASNFASTKAQDFIKNNVEIKNTDVLAKTVGDVTKVATEAAVQGKDIGDAIANSATKIAVDAGKSIINNQPANIGNQTFPVRKDIGDTMLASGDDIDIDLDALEGKDDTKTATGDTTPDISDYLNNTTAGLGSGTKTDVGAGTRPDQAMGLQPREGEKAGVITTDTLSDGSEIYSRTITGVDANGKPYSYTATWDPGDSNRPYSYETRTEGLTHLTDARPDFTVIPDDITKGGQGTYTEDIDVDIGALEGKGDADKDTLDAEDLVDLPKIEDKTDKTKTDITDTVDVGTLLGGEDTLTDTDLPKDPNQKPYDDKVDVDLSSLGGEEDTLTDTGLPKDPNAEVTDGEVDVDLSSLGGGTDAVVDGGDDKLTDVELPKDPNAPGYTEDIDVDVDLLDPDGDTLNPEDIPEDPNQKPYDEEIGGDGDIDVDVDKPDKPKPPVNPPVKPPVNPPVKPPVKPNNANLSSLLSLLDSQPRAAQNITPQELAKIGYFYDVGGEDILAPTQLAGKTKEDKFKQFYATGGTVDDLFRILRS